MAKRTATKPTLLTALDERGAATMLARKLHISVSHLSDIKCGRRSPSLALALAIQHETGVSIESLLKGKAA